MLKDDADDDDDDDDDDDADGDGNGNGNGVGNGNGDGGFWFLFLRSTHCSDTSRDHSQNDELGCAHMLDLRPSTCPYHPHDTPVSFSKPNDTPVSFLSPNDMPVSSLRHARPAQLMMQPFGAGTCSSSAPRFRDLSSCSTSCKKRGLSKAADPFDAL